MATINKLVSYYATDTSALVNAIKKVSDQTKEITNEIHATLDKLIEAERAAILVRAAYAERGYRTAEVRPLTIRPLFNMKGQLEGLGK